MDEWRRAKLHEVAEDVTVGHVGPMAEQYRSSGVPFLRSQNVLPHRIDLAGVKFIDDDFHSTLKKSALQPGDVVTVRTGKPGATAVVPDSLVVANCADLVVTRPGPALDAHWLSYYVNEAAAAFVSAHLVGAVQQHFNVGAARNIELHMPPLAEQRAIAEVLGPLDDKIATNTVLAKSADAIVVAQLQVLLDASTDRPLSATAEFVNGKAFTKGASGTGRVVIRIAELNSGIGASTVFSDAKVADQYLARPGDVLFAWSGSLTLSRWFRDEAIINQHIFKVIPKPGYPTWLVHGLIARKLDDFKATAANKATTMGHIQRHHLDEVVPVPDPQRIAKDDAVMSALWQRALSAERESLKLAVMRDALLPLLMSGKVRVKAVEIVMGDVV